MFRAIAAGAYTWAALALLAGWPATSIHTCLGLVAAGLALQAIAAADRSRRLARLSSSAASSPAELEHDTPPVSLESVR